MLGPAVETLQSRVDGGEAGTFDFAFIGQLPDSYVSEWQGVYFQFWIKYAGRI